MKRRQSRINKRFESDLVKFEKEIENISVASPKKVEGSKEEKKKSRIRVARPSVSSKSNKPKKESTKKSFAAKEKESQVQRKNSSKMSVSSAGNKGKE